MDVKPKEGEIVIAAIHIDSKGNTVYEKISTIKTNGNDLREIINGVKKAIEAFIEKNCCCAKGWRI
jgi:hypothetical protein